MPAVDQPAGTSFSPPLSGAGGRPGDLSLLLGTHHALVWWKNGEEVVLHSGQGVYYGITWNRDELFVVARGNHPSRMLALDRNLWPLTPPPYVYMGQEDDGPHQAFWSEGRLYVTNTQANRVEVWDQLGGEITHIYFGAPVSGDVDHLNSVWRKHENGCFYFVEHRLDQMPKRIRVWSPEDGLVHTIELHSEWLNDGHTTRGLHNVYAEMGYVYTLGAYMVLRYDWTTGEERAIELDGIRRGVHYLRGLARTDDLFLIGVSRASTQEGRGWGESLVLLCDDDFQIVDVIELDERYGQIMEIRVVSERDWAHNDCVCPAKALK